MADLILITASAVCTITTKCSYKWPPPWAGTIPTTAMKTANLLIDQAFMCDTQEDPRQCRWVWLLLTMAA